MSSKCLILFMVIFFASLESEEQRSPLYEGLGDYKMPISSSSDEAKKYFNQGLIFLYGYNYPEAIRSFLEATRCDPKSGICYWGAAVAAGECVEEPGDRWCVQAYENIQKAEQLNLSRREKEQDLIAVLSGRFEKKHESYSLKDDLFIDAMRRLHEKYPDDPDIAAIYANFYMYQVDMEEGIVNGKPTGETKEIIDALEKGLIKHPFHPGLNHFYIHAMESAGMPKKAIGAAERLDGLVPISGHLQHMPAHIYFYFGRYHEASAANQRGIDADLRLFAQGGIKDPEFAGFYLHNFYYLFHSLSAEGRTKEALAAARNLNRMLDRKELPSNIYLRNVFSSVPYLLMTRYGMWDAIKQEAAPDSSLLFTVGAWRYANGWASLRKGEFLEAKKQFEQLAKARERYDREEEQFSLNLLQLFDLFLLDLEGGLAVFRDSGSKKHVENLTRALPIEESMYLGMLPWYMPVRQALGQAYLDQDLPKEAEIAFLDELDHHPKNGWALYGLTQSLKRQGRDREADLYEKELSEAWQYADLTLTGARL